ncbi:MULTISPECIES: TonB-dependent receptor [unclassified Sphingomonas]|uniref:TonB-dependent receptor plug domain-containing protein n=1 Tax=unclassified Sphingomonas TaxID=196159 RepID=UPI0010495BAF|nr:MULTISPECIES: TonB-dependent receptor [unclassified Sphingomonas]TCQ00810.1 iron complex outermembrane receptor protein [Sphingomonas sp. PP-F2F-A104-K0414]TCQ08330.1 iron complex outermembrane receptor protein [Sphingomonas sp. PP-CC-3A-396]
MTAYRTALALAASTFALVIAQAAFAQDMPAQDVRAQDVPAQTAADPSADPAAAAAPDTQDDIIVTGTRAVGRSRLDSASPVDVLSSAAIQRQGTTELGAALAAIAPSIDFPRPSAVDGTDAIRPATLRGLSPDQTLVLVNGVRGHTAALLNVGGSVGRGSAAVDLNTIPTVALDRIEVLRDGASAQYGSDAIAGVINLRLREARSGGAATVNYGFYNTDIDTARGSRSRTGEHAVTVSGWQGLGFGEDGFLTLSGEYLNREATNRADFDPRVPGTRVTGRFGDPAVEQYSIFANAGTTLTGTWKLYGWLGYQDRDTRSAAFPRLANATTALAGYLDGFLPLINTKSRDINSAVGIKGVVADWNVDLNASYGRNKIGFRTLNSANYAFGSTTPKDFSDGALIYDQYIVGLDVDRKFDLLQGVNVAFGLEGRREGFKIEAGELASYGYPAAGTVTGAAATAAPGAQGFGGFSPANAIERSRRNGSVYLDVEAQVTDKFLVGLAGRGEDYSDFGSTATGKLSARYDFTRWFALRGTASTGFRAPALQQQYFTSIATVIQNGNPIQTGTFPSISPVASRLGGLPLEPEKSTNLSAGAVIRAGRFDLTVDAYRIHIRNQIGLSENISTSPTQSVAVNTQIANLLAGSGATAARFFLNGLASTTKGIDAVAHYRMPTDSVGTFDLTIAGNINDSKVTRVPTSTSALNPAPTLFARSRILTLEDGTPGEKVTGSIDWSLEQFGALARVTYYGDVNQPGTTAAADVHSGKHVITDIELRYQATKGAQLGFGVSNLFDVYPDATIPANNSTGVIGFPYYSPFGFNGRYLYARAGLSW